MLLLFSPATDTWLFQPRDASRGGDASYNVASQAEAREHERANERALVERLCDGDTDAFATIMASYTARLIQFAYDTVGSRDAAEDVVQSVFIHVWEMRATIDPDRPLKPYLYRAVRNRALNERQADTVRGRHRAQVYADAAAGIESAAVASPETRIVDTALVQWAVAQIAERRRIALRLRFEDGMTHVEIAEVLGVTSEAAKRLVSRAIADVRALVEPYYR